jgi:hypothetical protein
MDKITLQTVELPAALSDLGASIDREIRSFLNGDSDGGELFRGLYGDTVDEPMPQRLGALLSR